MSISVITVMLKEMEHEAQTTRKMLAVVPEGKGDWKPHPKSMSLGELSTHLAEIIGWVHLILTTDYLDFAENPYQLPQLNTNQELLNFFEETYAKSHAAFAATNEEELQKMWDLKQGDMILSHETKLESIRHTFCQVVHHRAQLGVFLRLLNKPIPGSYGPSADELEAMMQTQEN